MPAFRCAKAPTVLFVDDEPLILRGIELALNDADFCILTAASGLDALDILRTVPVDILVTDELMPGMRGSELLARAAAKHPNIVGIVLTGNASLEAAIHAINAGRVFRYLKKPVKPGELLDALFEAAKKRAAESSQVPGLTREDRLALSTRELEIVEALTSGSRVGQIAEALSLSPHTVRNHLKSIYQKLGVHSQAELIARARRT